MTDREQQLKAYLDKLAAEPGIVGAALVSRDGISVLDAFKQPIHPETFSAMSATLMGAAEVALADLTGKRLRRVLANTDDVTLIAVGVSTELILVALADRGQPLDGFLAQVDEIAEHLTALTAG